MFNKTRHDFKSLDEYDDYLIQIEDLIDCLTNDNTPDQRYYKKAKKILATEG